MMSEPPEEIYVWKDLPESCALKVRELYIHMQTPLHKEACNRLFESDANELCSNYRHEANEDS